MKTKTAAVLLLSAAVLFAGCKRNPAAPVITAEAAAAFAEAAFGGNTAAVLLALGNGMPVDQTDEDNNTALMLAAFNGHTETVRALLAAGAGINRYDNNGRTALMFAATGPNLATITLLLENGAEVNAVDHTERWTPLMFAAGEGLSPVVDLLIAAGADPKMKDKDNDTAADFAYNRGFTQLAAKLRKLMED